MKITKVRVHNLSVAIGTFGFGGGGGSRVSCIVGDMRKALSLAYRLFGTVAKYARTTISRAFNEIRELLSEFYPDEG